MQQDAQARAVRRQLRVTADCLHHVARPVVETPGARIATLTEEEGDKAGLIGRRLPRAVQHEAQASAAAVG